MSPFSRPNPPTEPRRPWVSPVLKVVGTIAEVVQAGVGKLSATPIETGDGKKPPGQ
jgi:hypothetical protein